MIKILIGTFFACAAVLAATEPDYIRERDAASQLKAEEALSAFVKLADGPFSAAQKSDALEQASSRAVALKRYDEAMELAKRIPTLAISKAAQMRVLSARGDWKVLVTKFKDEDIDAWWPDYLNAEAFFCRGRALAAAGDGTGAAADLRKAADRIHYDDNSRALALIALGNAFSHILKDDTRAIAAFRETYATQAHAKRCEAALGVAGVLTRQGKLDDALSELKTIDRSKMIPYWLGALLAGEGAILAQQGKIDAASATYREALRIEGLHPAQKAAFQKSLGKLGK